MNKLFTFNHPPAKRAEARELAINVLNTCSDRLEFHRSNITGYQNNNPSPILRFHLVSNQQVTEEVYTATANLLALHLQ